MWLANLLVLLAVSFLSVQVRAREFEFWDEKPKYLVFEGGGNRAFAYCGTLYELERLGYLSDVTGAAGASAGSVFAVLVSAGYSATEITEAMLRTDFSKFAGRSWWPTKLWNLFNNFGLIEGHEVLDWISALLEAKGLSGDITFRQLHATTGRELIITGSDISIQRPVYFSRDSFPEMQIRHAVRASMSIPVLYTPVHIDVPPSVVPDMHVNGTESHMFVDGGVFNNYPLRAFDRPMETLNDLPLWRHSKVSNAAPTLGFKMIDNDERFDPERLEITERHASDPQSVGTYLVRLLTSLQNVLGDWQSTPDAQLFWRRTVLVSSGDFNTVNYDFTVEQKTALFKLGIQSAHDALPPSMIGDDDEEEVERLFAEFLETNKATIKSVEEAEKVGCRDFVDGVEALCSALEHISTLVPGAENIANCDDDKTDL